MQSNSANLSYPNIDYELLAELGKGSFGIVYRVRRKSDGVILVLKQINIAQLPAPLRSAALNEVKILSSLDNPYIVKYYDSFIEKNMLNIFMEYCEGGDLSQYMKQFNGKPLHENKIWKFFIQMCLGLDYIHQKKILHRDIKSLNIFLTKDENIRIGDLGVAKVLAETTNFAHTMVGTPYYLSPEMAEEKPYNEKSDVWALGCVLYQLCTGRHPFEASNQAALLLKIIRGKYAPIPNIYSNELAEVIDHCLRKDVKKRCSTQMILSKIAVITQASLLGISLEEEQEQLNKEKLHKGAKRKKGNAPSTKAKLQPNENLEPKKQRQRLRTGKKKRPPSEVLKAPLKKEENETLENEKLEEVVPSVKLPRIRGLEIDSTPPKDEKPVKAKKPRAIKSTPKSGKAKPGVSKNGAAKQVNTPNKINTKQDDPNNLNLQNLMLINGLQLGKAKSDEKKTEQKAEIFHPKEKKLDQPSRNLPLLPRQLRSNDNEPERNIGRIRKGAPQAIARAALQVGQQRSNHNLQPLNSRSEKDLLVIDTVKGENKKEKKPIKNITHSDFQLAKAKHLAIRKSMSVNPDEEIQPKGRKKLGSENLRSSVDSSPLNVLRINSDRIGMEKSEYQEPLASVNFDMIQTPHYLPAHEVVVETELEHEGTVFPPNKDDRRNIQWRILSEADVNEEDMISAQLLKNDMKNQHKYGIHQEILLRRKSQNQESNNGEPNYDNDFDEDQENGEHDGGMDSDDDDDFNDRNERYFDDPRMEKDVNDKIKELEDQDDLSLDSAHNEEGEEENEHEHESPEKKLAELQEREKELKDTIQQKVVELKELMNPNLAEEALNFFRALLRTENDINEAVQQEIGQFIKKNLHKTGMHDLIVYSVYKILHLENELDECRDTVSECKFRLI